MILFYSNLCGYFNHSWSGAVPELDYSVKLNKCKYNCVKNVRQYNVLNILSKLLIWQIRVYAWYEKYFDEVSPHPFNSKKSMTLMLIIDDNFINSKLHVCLTAPALSPGTKYVFSLMCICLFCKQLRSLTDLKCNSGIIIIFLCKCFPWSAHLWYHHLLIGGYASTNMIILSHFCVPEVKR